MPKRPIRREILAQRLLHQGSEEKKIKDKKISAALEEADEFKNAERILFYAPVNGEVGTFETIKKYIKEKKIFLPKTNRKDHRLHIHKVDDLDNLKTGAFGIREPHYTSETAPGDMDLVIVPGVAFDLKGHRIGFGLGYYDRLLKETKCPKIGLAYEFQIIENVPGEPHDVPADIIITEKRIINTH